MDDSYQSSSSSSDKVEVWVFFLKCLFFPRSVLDHLACQITPRHHFPKPNYAVFSCQNSPLKDKEAEKVIATTLYVAFRIINPLSHLCVRMSCPLTHCKHTYTLLNALLHQSCMSYREVSIMFHHNPVSHERFDRHFSIFIIQARAWRHCKLQVSIHVYELV